MAKVTLDCSSGKGIVFLLDGKIIPSVFRVDNISELHNPAEMKEVTITLLAEEVEIKK